MKSNLFLLIAAFALAVLAFQNCKDDNNNSEIVVPAGSTNAIAQAIADVTEGGTVRLAAGTHTEDSRILIDKKICLVGDPGAVLVSDTKPVVDTNNIVLRVAIHVLNATGACIENIEIQPVDPVGGTAILVELSDDVIVRNCKLTRHQFSIIIEMSNRIAVSGNEIIGALDAFEAGLITPSHGLVIVNGKDATITTNTISNNVFGAWLCDEGGLFDSNTTFANAIGVVGCIVPKYAVGELPRNPIPFTERTAKDWVIKNNKSFDNAPIFGGAYLGFGYALADGSNNNLLSNNEGGGSNKYDIVLFGDNNYFGFPQPRSMNNAVLVGSFPNVTVKDCGENNVVDATNLIDTSDPAHACEQ